MSRSPLPFRVVPCAEWGAAQPSGAIARAGKPDKTLFHHTAGHVPNLSAGETYAEACAYARAIQRYHMGQGWVDSGHNFLITRGGFILEGRHGSLTSCRAGVMVVSAHCPEQNTNPGIEHEHNGREKMTAIQRAASVWLNAQLCRWGGIKPSDCAQPHSKFFATACPGTLKPGLPALRADVRAALAPVDDKAEAWFDKYGPKNKPPWFFKALQEYARRLDA
jgi:hypothetical protein